MEVQSIAEQLFFTTVKMELETARGLVLGPGFFFDYKAGEKDYIFVVTNKHVITNASRGRFFFNVDDEGKPNLGEKFTATMDNFKEKWFTHPDPSVDVAVTPFAPIYNSVREKRVLIFFRTINANLIPNNQALSELDTIEEIVFVGYPIGLSDSVNNTPIARRGITATPINIDYEGKKQFLIDASVFPGSSGSPVFIFNRGSYPEKKGGLVIGGRFLFIGLVAAVIYEEETGRIESLDTPYRGTPIVKIKQMIDLGIVYKGVTVVETIEAFLASTT